jgi:hypothetical protein
MTKTSYVRKWGYSLIDIGKHMGVSYQRVYQLIKAGSPRVGEALKEMKAAERVKK